MLISNKFIKAKILVLCYKSGGKDASLEFPCAYTTGFPHD